MSLQEVFAAALLDSARIDFAGLISSPTPLSRFAIYRNNVLGSLKDALADNFPVVVQLVGDVFFNAMARAFVQAHPPRSRSLIEYGEAFADFIETFEPAACLPNLADVARLERLRVRAYHAADIEPVSLAVFAELVAEPEFLAELRLSLHPGLSILTSDYAICSLWQAHQPGGELGRVDPYLPELTLVLRWGLEVELLVLDAGTCAFIQALRGGVPLGRAANCALHLDAEFDLVQCLSLLIGKAVITHLQR